MPKHKLSKTGQYLFNQAYNYSKDINIKKNTCCINNLLHNLFTSKYDLELEETALNMKASSYKIFSYIYNHDKIKKLNRTAIYNIILLILTNGENTITPQKVKCNIHFYLDLALKAMKDNDHQTAIVIKTALENKYVSELNIRYNKSMIKKFTILSERYGYYRDYYVTHLAEIITKYVHKYYIPSSLVLNLTLNSQIINNNTKDKKTFNNINYRLHIIYSEKYNQYNSTRAKLCPIYNTDPLTLSNTQNILEANKIKNTNFDEVMDKLLKRYFRYINYQIHLLSKNK
jgi:hypothetical protein